MILTQQFSLLGDKRNNLVRAFCDHKIAIESSQTDMIPDSYGFGLEITGTARSLTETLASSYLTDERRFEQAYASLIKLKGLFQNRAEVIPESGEHPVMQDALNTVKELTIFTIQSLHRDNDKALEM